MRFLGTLVLLTILTCGCSTPRAGSAAGHGSAAGLQPAHEAAATTAVEQIREEARALNSFVSSRTAHEFLGAAAALPSIAPRTLYRDAQRRYYTAAQMQQLPEAERGKLEEVSVDEAVYYTTRYGTPMSYCRALDLAASFGFNDISGKKILDFGYGYIGHLRMWASMGADVVGVEVDELLRALYSDAQDQGEIHGRRGRTGHLRLVHGQYPADAGVAAAVGGGYDFIISKNVLKNGYLHPAQPVDPRRLVHLGVDDGTFVKAIYAALSPGGYFMIYNLYPAQNPPDKEYIPWADGRCPFPQAMLESAGFRVLAFDQDDSQAIRRMAHILGWDRGEEPMDLEGNLFAEFTVTQKPRE